MAQTEYMTLAIAVDGLTRSGFREHFQMKANKLLVLDSGTTFNPSELVIRAYHRFEGVSDLDDMAIVYAIESHSGVRGTLVDAVGVYARVARGYDASDCTLRPGLSGARVRGSVAGRRRRGLTCVFTGWSHTFQSR